MLQEIAAFLPYYALVFVLSWMYFIVGSALVHHDLHRRPSRFRGKLPLRWTVAAIAAVSGGLTFVSVLVPR